MSQVSFSFEFDYKIDGRKVSKEEFMWHLADEAKSAAVDGLQVRVARLRCPVHGQSPRVVNSTTNGDTTHIELAACCEDVRDRAGREAFAR
jgi:hypothetical protein